MPDHIFSEFLLVDKTRETDPRSGPSVGLAAGRGRGEENARNALMRAVAKALEETRFIGGHGHDMAIRLATAMTEIAFGQAAVLRMNPNLGEVQREAAKVLFEKVIQVVERVEANRLEAAITKLADVILPDELGEALGPLAADNLEIRDRFVAQVPCLKSAEVGARAGLRSTNPYATAARWKKAGDVISVNHRGAEYFPTFQFRDGRPHPTVKKALAELPDTLSPWQRALWFVSTNGWLDDKAPADVLDDHNAVVEAAKREREEVIG